jgi:hypothetical protein
MSDRFILPAPFDASIPFTQLHVWQWAKTQAREDVQILNYLAALGFRMGVDRLDTDDYKTLEYAIDAFHRCAPRIDGVRPLSAVLPAATGPEGFYCRGLPHRVNPSDELRAALAAAGWIYDVAPESTYFEILPGGRLFARYQEIIGTRFLCEVTE